MNILTRNKTTSDLRDERYRTPQKSPIGVQSNFDVWQQVLSLDARFSHIRPILKEDASNRTLYIRRRYELSREHDRAYQPTHLDRNDDSNAQAASSGKVGNTVPDRVAYKVIREKLLTSLYGSSASVKSLPQVFNVSRSKNVDGNARCPSSGCSSVPDPTRSPKSLSDCGPSSIPQDHLVHSNSTEESVCVPHTHNTKLADPSSKPEGYLFSGIDHIFDHHAGAINRLRFANNDNSRLAIASSDGTISICSSWPPGEERRVLHVLFGGHPPATPITDLVWSIANDFLVSTALDGSVCLWDVADGSVKRIYPAVSLDVGPALVCAFQPVNFNFLVVGGAWGRIQTLNLSTGKLVKKGKDQVHSTGFKSAKSISWDQVTCTGQGCILALTFDQGSGTSLWVGTDRGVIQSYCCQPATGHLIRSQRLNLAARRVARSLEDPFLAADEAGPYGIALLPAALSQTGRTARAMTESSSFLRSSLRRKTTELLTGQHTAETAFPSVTSLAVYSWLVRGTGDAYLLANAAGLGLLLFKITSPTATVSTGMLTLERRFRLKHRSPIPGPNCVLRVIHSCFSPLLSSQTGAYAISGSEDGNVCVYDILSKPAVQSSSSAYTHLHQQASFASTGLVTVLQGHRAPVLDVSIGWDESVLASGDESGSVIIWRRRAPPHVDE